MTGGWDGDNNLDSTEVLRPGSDWQEITSARLPRPMDGVRVITVDNRVLLFGGEWKHILILTACTFLTLACVTGGHDSDERYDDILEYNKNSGSWSKLGVMNKARRSHGLGVVSINDFPDCNRF